MAEILYDDLILCECCAMVVVNDDESACRDYYGHEHPSVRDKQFSGHLVLKGDAETVYRGFCNACDGCGQEILYGATIFSACELS